MSLLWLLPFFAWCSFASELSFDFRQHMRHSGHHGQGFELTTALAVPLSFSHSDSQLGISSGNYFDIAGKMKIALHYRSGLHDWSTSGFVAESYTITPAIEDRWVKTLDLLRLESRYLYNIAPNLSLFAYARMETSLFNSIDLHDSTKKFELRNVDNTVRKTFTGTEIKIADALRPLYLQQGVGAALGTVQQSYLTHETKAALSFRQTLADGQKVFVDEVEDVRIIRDLYSFFQIGPLVGSAIRGELFNKKLRYTAGADVTWPLWQYPVHKRSFLDSLIIEAAAGLSFDLSENSSISYQYGGMRIPDILPDFQQHHMVNLVFEFDWVHRFGENKS